MEPTSPSATITQQDIDAFLNILKLGPSDVARAQAVEQRTPEWHAFRKHRLTSSNFGAAAGHNDNKTPNALLMDMMWPSFQGNEATEYGTIMESTAFAIITIGAKDLLRKRGYDNVWLEETGITLSTEHPYLAGSGDGIIYATGPNVPPLQGNLELKAPWKNKEFYDSTPHSHYDQFMGVAYLQNSQLVIYGVYTPTATQMNTYTPNREYWLKTLFPVLEKFYMQEYLPRAILKERGLIKPGNLQIITTIQLTISATTPKKKVDKDDKKRKAQQTLDNMVKKRSLLTEDEMWK